MSFSETYTADLRLVALEILTAADAETSLAVLKAAIADASLHRVSSEQLQMEVQWLAERGLVTLRKIAGVIDAVIITERGRDVAGGRKRLLGVAAPELG